MSVLKPVLARESQLKKAMKIKNMLILVCLVLIILNVFMTTFLFIRYFTTGALGSSLVANEQANEQRKMEMQIIQKRLNQLQANYKRQEKLIINSQRMIMGLAEVMDSVRKQVFPHKPDQNEGENEGENGENPDGLFYDILSEMKDLGEEFQRELKGRGREASEWIEKHWDRFHSDL